MSSNFDSQIAYGLEATPGTRQAPSRRIEHVSFTPTPAPTVIKGKGMMPTWFLVGRRPVPMRGESQDQAGEVGLHTPAG